MYSLFRTSTYNAGVQDREAKNKMVQKKNQNWSVGEWVKVGFMKLKVEGVRAEFDGLPDIYSLVSEKGKKYEFIPHNGLYTI